MKVVHLRRVGVFTSRVQPNTWTRFSNTLLNAMSDTLDPGMDTTEVL